VSESKSFDRGEENIGNVMSLQHINFTVPDQQLAYYFYISGLGFTRDPYIDFGTLLWVNAGEQQFHILPTGKAQKWRGHIAVVVPDLTDLKRRLESVAKPLAKTEFAWEEKDDHVGLTCPWGNDMRAYGPDKFPGRYIGIPYAEMEVAPGTSEGIARFYERVIATPATVKDDKEGKRVEVSMGFDQRLVYKETDREIDTYDGHHIAIHIANFSAPHDYLVEHDLVMQEDDEHQYRFKAIVDPDSGETLAELEHEVRSLRHPMFKRNLVNRNAAQTFFNYGEGRDAFYPG
jgi:hypothetical protein